MGKDIEMIKRYCFVTQSENKLLISSESPIVLLKKRNIDYLPKNIAPGQKDWVLCYHILQYINYFFMK